jgi:1-acyl-sn-glycerol-3-phosphate acyltransferase
VVPGNGRPAFEAALRRLREGRSVVIFPEGDVSPKGGGFHQPRTGAARLALLTGAPVIPVGIYLVRQRNCPIEMDIAGTRCVSYVCLRGKYALTVGEPISYEGRAEDRTQVTAVAEDMMARIICMAGDSERRATAPSTP